MFADDATFMTDGSKSSFEKLVHVIEEFSKISGLKLNTNKSIVLRVGALKKTMLKLLPEKVFKWTSVSAKTLGITFSNNNADVHEYNIMQKVLEFEQCLEKWKRRKLSLIGKITVIKTFAAPN